VFILVSDLNLKNKEANNFFIDLVIKHNHQNHFYSLERYKDHKNNTLKKFDYLTLLMEESKLL
jgi:hypothetical protein